MGTTARPTRAATYEMRRAARLVIDTGIHHKGWSRDQPWLLRDNTALSEHEVTTEIDRYISWPAQALSYKPGEMIVKLRAEAEAALGDALTSRPSTTPSSTRLGHCRCWKKCAPSLRIRRRRRKRAGAERCIPPAWTGARASRRWIGRSAVGRSRIAMR